jgi:Histone methylation protein DOT1
MESVKQPKWAGPFERLRTAWGYTEPHGSALRRASLMVTWSYLKAEEGLTDVYYRRRGLCTMSRDLELHQTQSSLNGYAPTRWRALRELFRNCTVGSGDVLLEYGSGKGRAVIWAAAHFPFRRVIGVELDEQLHKEAVANLARWNGRLLCDDIVLTCADATEFEVPDDVTALYLFNPFTGDAFRKVIARIQESLARQPRSLQVIYCNPLMHEALIDAGFSVDRQRIDPPYDWAIYRHSGLQARSGQAASVQ